MALSFPANPTNGQVYTDTVTGNRYLFNSTANVWSYAANNVGVSVTSTPPSGVAEGSMWWNRDTGRMFVRYNDGTSTQWVETTPSPTLDTNLIASYTNPVYAQANLAFVTANNFANTYNSAYVVANAAFGVANTALQNTTGTFSGTLTVTDNLSVGGGNPYGYKIIANNSNSVATTWIGSYNPGALGAIGAGFISVISGSNYGYMYQSSSGHTYITNANTTGNLYFGTASTVRATFDNSGNLGLGTATLNAKFQIVNTVGNAGAANMIRLYEGGGSIFGLGVSPGQLDYRSDAHVFYTTGTTGVERARIDTSVLSLTGLQGIKFQATQSASSDANTLDDYEEGTWTPTYIGSTTNPTVSYTGRVGKYTKIGNLVICHVFVRGTLTGGSGNIYIGGLPFTVATGSGYGMYGNRVTSWAWSGGSAVQSVNPTDSTNYAVLWDASTNIIPVSNAGGAVLGTFYYYTT